MPTDDETHHCLDVTGLDENQLSPLIHVAQKKAIHAYFAHIIVIPTYVSIAYILQFLLMIYACNYLAVPTKHEVGRCFVSSLVIRLSCGDPLTADAGVEFFIQKKVNNVPRRNSLGFHCGYEPDQLVEIG